MITYKGIEYCGLSAHRSWKGKSLPKTLWTLDGDVSYHFPGLDEGYGYDLVGYVKDIYGNRYKKWRSFKLGLTR